LNRQSAIPQHKHECIERFILDVLIAIHQELGKLKGTANSFGQRRIFVCQIKISTEKIQSLSLEQGFMETMIENTATQSRERCYSLASIQSAEVVSLPAQCIHQLIEARVAIQPEAIAVETGDRCLSYNTLNAQANQLARYLQTLGIERNGLVAIVMDRSLEMTIAILAVLKAGGAYLPIDPTYPAERIAYMLSDSQASVILTHQPCASIITQVLPKHHVRVIYLDRDWKSCIASESDENLPRLTHPDDLAYVMYTSGSTGKPKGVEIQHQGLVNHATAIVKLYSLSVQDRVLQFSALSFDIAVEEIFPTWIAGATLVLRTADMIASVQTFSEAIAHQQITLLSLPTAFWHEWVRGMERLDILPPVSLRLVAVGGEKASRTAFMTWHKRVGHRVRWVNTYGPTEATVSATCYEPTCCNEVAETEEIPIGLPLPNTQVCILDQNLQPCPIGVSGELHIGGIGLARGYLHQPELTRQKFIPNPWHHSNQPGSDRLYKTGDLARYRPDGNIEFLGRLDNQVKIRGFRIELAEIETVLNQHPSISEAVIVVDEQTRQQRLIAYLVARDSDATTLNALTPAAIATYLKQSLPDYMVPSTCRVIDTLPTTPSGKIDRRALVKLTPSRLTTPTNEIASQKSPEAKLIEIWETALGIQPISTTDNFWEIGGNSLQAMAIFVEIEATFQRRIPLATLIQAPTITQLAEKLQDNQWQASWNSLVAIQPLGTKPPLFFVHPIKGDVLCYTKLAQRLGETQPFYGLQAQGLDGKSKVAKRIEDLAAAYIGEIKRVQPQGPYFLGGYSLGGIIAFEMAQQLHQQGCEVKRVALLDPYPPQFLSPFHRAVRHLKRLSDLKPTTARIAYLWDRFSGRLRQELVQLQRQVGQPLSPESNKFLIEETLHQAFSSYRARPYPGRLTLFKSQEVFVDDDLLPSAPIDGTLLWSNLALQGMDVHPVPGTHANLLDSPCVEVLSEKLQQYLE
jgi:amino acid adenylation domain-containing protein